MYLVSNHPCLNLNLLIIAISTGKYKSEGRLNWNLEKMNLFKDFDGKWKMFKINYLLQAVIIHSDAARAPLGHISTITYEIAFSEGWKENLMHHWCRTLWCCMVSIPFLSEKQKNDLGRITIIDYLRHFFLHFKDPQYHGNPLSCVWLLVDLPLKWSIDRINYNWLPYPLIHIQIELLQQQPSFLFWRY